MRKEKIPADFPVKPLRPNSKAARRAKDLAECGQCGRFWDDGKPTTYTPVPGARCPFEYFHEEEGNE